MNLPVQRRAVSEPAGRSYGSNTRQILLIPRPYQSLSVEKANKHLKRAKAATLVFPTGSGKTVIAALHIKTRHTENNKRRFLMLQHTEELLDQNMKTVAWGTGLKCSIVRAEINDWSGDVVFASVPTLCRDNRLADLSGFTDLIIDECHHSAAPSWLKIIEKAIHQNPKLRILAMTATPDRGDNLPLPDHLGKIVHRVFIQEMIDEGYLVPPRAFSVNLGVNDELAKIDQSSFDADEAIAKILDTPAFNAAVVEQWKARANNRPTVAFCSTIQHAKNVAEAFNSAGIPAVCIDANTKKSERRQIIADYKEGKYKVITNCLLLTEGFDHQPVSCVIVLRAMLHVSTFVQALGRAMRVVDAEKHPGIIKFDAICLDFAAAAVRHAELDTKTNLKIDDVDLRDLKEQEELPINENLDDVEETDRSFIPQLEEIDLGMSQFRWTDIHGDGRTLLVSGVSGFASVLKAGQNWAAVGREMKGDLHVLHIGGRAQAYGAASDFIRRVEKDDRAVGNRRWLNDPMSPGQAAALAKCGYTRGEIVNLNKYEASCYITYVNEKRHVTKEVRRHLELARQAMGVADAA